MLPVHDGIEIAIDSRDDDAVYRSVYEEREADGSEIADTTSTCQ